jgi:tetratricopeptide (TPR) repeat protein
MNMKKEHKIAQEIDAISELINSGDYQKALDRFCDLETNNPKNNTIKFNKVAFLIDIGLGLKNSKIVKEGIVTGEKLLKDSSYKNQKTNIYYNCANGYVSFYHLEYDRERDAKQVDNENLQNAKRNFREAIKEANHFDSKFRSKLWTNYGNCLDSLGRGVEALYAYDEALKIDHGFPMALGNKAMAMRFFADISGDEAKSYREAVYIKSYQILMSVLKNKDLVKFGGITAKKSFENETKQIEGRFKDKSRLSKNLEHPQCDLSHATSFERFYIEFCSKHKLFLNFHIHENEGEASIVDPITYQSNKRGLCNSKITIGSIAIQKRRL